MLIAPTANWQQSTLRLLQEHAAPYVVIDRLEDKRVHPDGRPAGLNLTRASLDAATKYPWGRGEGPGDTAKFGVYEDDRPVFDWFREGAEPDDRCLEAEVMDWSDDVAYSVHDVEDAIASGRVDPRVLYDPTEVRVVADVAVSYTHLTLPTSDLV